MDLLFFLDVVVLKNHLPLIRLSESPMHNMPPLCSPTIIARIVLKAEQECHVSRCFVLSVIFLEVSIDKLQMNALFFFVVKGRRKDLHQNPDVKLGHVCGLLIFQGLLPLEGEEFGSWDDRYWHFCCLYFHDLLRMF